MFENMLKRKNTVFHAGKHLLLLPRDGPTWISTRSGAPPGASSCSKPLATKPGPRISVKTLKPLGHNTSADNVLADEAKRAHRTGIQRHVQRNIQR